MERLHVSRRQILKAGAVVVAGLVLDPRAVFAQEREGHESMGPFGPWTNAMPLAELASTSNDYHPAISKDGLSLYFTTDRQLATVAKIYVSRRADVLAPWPQPQAVDILNVKDFNGTPKTPTYNTGVPNLTPSRHVIYFQSSRPDALVAEGSEAGDLYVSRRKEVDDDFGWDAPVLVPGQIDNGAAQSAATYFEDASGARLYFARFAGIGVIGQPDQDFDIYVSFEDADGNFGPGQIVTPLNAVPQPGDPPHTWSRDTRTAIRRDGLEMYVTSNRHFGLTYSRDPIENLWVSTRSDTATEDWSIPVLADGVNSGYGDGGPALSWDATTLYFFSQRRTVLGKPGKRQLWMATRERV
jgi:hypothetical protein